MGFDLYDNQVLNPLKKKKKKNSNSNSNLKRKKDKRKKKSKITEIDVKLERDPSMGIPPEDFSFDLFE